MLVKNCLCLQSGKVLVIRNSSYYLCRTFFILGIIFMWKCMNYKNAQFMKHLSRGILVSTVFKRTLQKGSEGFWTKSENMADGATMSGKQTYVSHFWEKNFFSGRSCAAACRGRRAHSALTLWRRNNIRSQPQQGRMCQTRGACSMP